MSDFQYTPRSVSTIKLHARTMAPATIATIMRCSIGTVELICRKHGIEMREADYVETLAPPPERGVLRNKRVEVDVDPISFILIANEARRRGKATRDLMAELLQVIADDKMFNAVLDDK